MAHLVVAVLEDPSAALPLLRAWIAAGASGATILESMGLTKLTRSLRDDLPLLPSLLDVEERPDPHNRTVFSVVDDEDTLARVISASESVVGDFSKRGIGLLFVVPVSQVLGLRGGKSAPPSGAGG